MLLLLVGGIVGCGETAVPTPLPIPASTPIPTTNTVPLGNRILSMDATEAADNDYDAALQRAKAVGVTAVTLTVYWDDIETEPGVYNPDPNWLEVANLYYPTQNVVVSLAISVIDTNNLRLPPDLADKSFDDPAVIERFNRLLDYVVTQVPAIKLNSLAIGNEIDIYLEADTEQWAAYETFFRETAAHARTLWPNLPIGTKTTFEGISGDPAPYIQSINQHSDVVLVTYYPLNPDFNVREPATVHNDFQTLADAFPNQTIYLLEVGYPSGTDNNSSYAKQAAFIHELFLAWDAHAAQIPLINYTWLTDMPLDSVKELTSYYRLAAPGFVSYLATLGLRTFDNTDKPAFRQLAAEMEARQRNK